MLRKVFNSSQSKNELKHCTNHYHQFSQEMHTKRTSYHTFHQTTNCCSLCCDCHQVFAYVKQSSMPCTYKKIIFQQTMLLIYQSPKASILMFISFQVSVYAKIMIINQSSKFICLKLCQRLVTITRTYACVHVQIRIRVHACNGVTMGMFKHKFVC